MSDALHSLSFTLLLSNSQENLGKPLTMENIDSSSGVLFPFWDEGTSMVYIIGKVGFMPVAKVTLQCGI